MFADHQPVIAAAGTRDAVSFERVCAFVLATIRCPFPSAVSASKRYYASGELERQAFFGAKLDGLAYVRENAASLLAECEYVARTSDEPEVELVDIFERIPGIGLAKAGFLAQLLYGRVGCLDTHNLVRFGLRVKEFRSLTEVKRQATRKAKIRQYVDTCAQLGSAAALWDDWCAYVGKTQGYGSAEQVSAMHLVVVAGKVAR